MKRDFFLFLHSLSRIPIGITSNLKSKVCIDSAERSSFPLGLFPLITINQVLMLLLLFLLYEIKTQMTDYRNESSIIFSQIPNQNLNWKVQWIRETKWRTIEKVLLWIFVFFDQIDLVLFFPPHQSHLSILQDFISIQIPYFFVLSLKANTSLIPRSVIGRMKIVSNWFRVEDNQTWSFTNLCNPFWSFLFLCYHFLVCLINFFCLPFDTISHVELCVLITF